jgi:mannose-1-phosphate guanylyltransferase
LKAVVLAGGLGTRLRPYTYLLPKPMLPVGSKPILEHIVEWLKDSGVKDIVIATGYLGRMIREYLGDGSELGVSIQYATSHRPLGTAGQLKSAEDKLSQTFVCVYGDALLRFDLAKALEFHNERKSVATMILMKYSTELKYGFIETDRTGRLTEWKEKPSISGYINVGCFVMEKKFLRNIPEDTPFEMDAAFKKAKARGERLFGYRAEGGFLDIGDRKAYLEANREYQERAGRGR